MKIVPITGKPGAGKTTLVTNIVEYLRRTHAGKVHLRGFVTKERREHGQRVGFDVHMYRGDDGEGILAKTARLATIEPLAGVSSACAPKVGKYNVCVHEFEAAALECLRCAGTSLVRTYENFSQVNSQTNLIVIDELGKMETYSNAFADAFEQLLDNQQSNDAGNTVLLVTMPMNATTQAPMMNTRIIRALVRANGGATTHTNVYEVTATNRNDLLNTICSRVESLLGLQNTM